MPQPSRKLVSRLKACAVDHMALRLLPFLLDEFDDEDAFWSALDCAAERDEDSVCYRPYASEEERVRSGYHHLINFHMMGWAGSDDGAPDPAKLPDL